MIQTTDAQKQIVRAFEAARDAVKVFEAENAVMLLKLAALVKQVKTTEEAMKAALKPLMPLDIAKDVLDIDGYSMTRCTRQQTDIAKALDAFPDLIQTHPELFDLNPAKLDAFIEGTLDEETGFGPYAALRACRSEGLDQTESGVRVNVPKK